MIDIHSHILPGLDDGSHTLEESVAMLAMAAAAGTSDIVASPHANVEYTFDPDLVKVKIAEVQAACKVDVQIHYGCDFHLTMENIEDALAHPGKYSINHKGYLLVEFSDMAIPRTTADIFRRMLDGGLRPIVTHPERNPLLQRRMPDLLEWANLGCLMQVTAASFSGRFGRAAENVSDQLMRNGLVHVVASDAHDTHHRPPVLDEMYRAIAKEYDEETATTLFVENPRAVLAGVPLPAGPVPVRRKKKWYQRL
jgi:protein-tyrosine phosphatase